MFYDRKIKYFDYLVKGERCGNAGFIKLEVRDAVCSITINVNSLRTTDSLSVKVCLAGAGKEGELCTLDLVQGRGVKQLLRQNAQNLGGTGIAYESLETVRIPISTEREIVGAIGTAVSVGQVDSEPEKPLGMPAAEIFAAAENVEEAAPEAVSELKAVTEAASEPEAATEAASEPEAVTETTLEPKAAPEAASEPKAAPEAASEQEASPEKRVPPVERHAKAEKAVKENKEKKIPLCDNKWKQLWEIYPHIAPFRDDRKYLSVGPNDFVILPEKYFRMANNSFLLHGYYNYKHLVLKRLEYRGKTRYYIGVPGNFYDREKQVALMFGFESFESMEEPACTGDYGYYLMRIEL